jgi:hypothetical protein
MEVTKFTPLEGGKQYTTHRPVRAKVREVFTVAAHTSDLAGDVRIKYARMAGMKPEEGKFNLLNEYDGYTSVPALARALFVDFPAEFDEDKLDEGEVNRAFIHFTTQRNGI